MLLFFVACAATEPGGDTAADTADTDAVDPTVAPAIVRVEQLACAEEGAVGDVWRARLAVDDPQGADTVVAGTVSVQDARGELGRYDLACDEAVCSSSFRADIDAIPCAASAEITFVFQVIDADDHYSETLRQPGG